MNAELDAEVRRAVRSFWTARLDQSKRQGRTGSAHDLWTAYREGAFSESIRPWLGYLMLLEECPASTRPVGVEEPHFRVFEVFSNSSYAQRYSILCQRLIHERLYDSACLLLSDPKNGKKGDYTVPTDELTMERFAASLEAHAAKFVKYLRK